MEQKHMMMIGGVLLVLIVGYIYYQYTHPKPINGTYKMKTTQGEKPVEIVYKITDGNKISLSMVADGTPAQGGTFDIAYSGQKFESSPVFKLVMEANDKGGSGKKEEGYFITKDKKFVMLTCPTDKKECSRVKDMELVLVE